MRRPDLRAYFRAQIDVHVHGMRSTVRNPGLPSGVQRVRGRVTDREIVAVMSDGTEWRWAGGRYAARKVYGCYAPLMPTPCKGEA